jgi:chromate transport protein ChrA
LVLAGAIYVACLIVFALFSSPSRLVDHTPFNHYAHLAHAWLHGRLDLEGGAPAYALGNDFASYGGRTYISFPPFPAVLMLPGVALAGSPEEFLDGQFVVLLAGLGPASLFLVLEALRRSARSTRSEQENVAWALLYAFGTVYFFTAVQGTVWFAAHVVAAALTGFFLLASLDGSRPVLAGCLLACAWTTRPGLLFLGVFFLYEAWRAREGDRLPRVGDRAPLARLLRTAVPFAIPVAVSVVLAALYNHARFETWSPSAFGHEHLGVAWRTRIEKWGLFGYHYLSKNLGIALTMLPWLPPKGSTCFDGSPGSRWLDVLVNFRSCVPFRVNVHGLALWFVTPFYLWLARPTRWTPTIKMLLATAALPAGLDLLYQNSGWAQFGYRFSNDYAPLLMVALALGGRPFGPALKVACAWAIAWNAFGAASFERTPFSRFYFSDGSQQILYQPD